MTKKNTTIRLEEDVKKEASEIASKLGISLSAVISLYLKNDFIVHRGIHTKLRDESGFTKEAGDDLKKLCKEAEEGIDVSKNYTDSGKLIDDLRKNEIKY